MAGWLEQLEGAAPRVEEKVAQPTPVPELSPQGAAQSAGWLPQIETPDPSLSVENALDAKPEAALKARQQAEATGLPIEAVEADPDTVDREVRRQQMTGWLASAPVTARAFEADPQLAREASDSVEKLSLFEQALDGFFAPAQFARNLGEKVMSGEASFDLLGGAFDGIYLSFKGAAALLEKRSNPSFADALARDGFTDLAEKVRDFELPWWLDPSQLLAAGLGGAEAVAGAAAKGLQPEDPDFVDKVLGGVGQAGVNIATALVLGPQASGLQLFTQGAGQQQEKIEKSGAEPGLATDAALVAGGAITAITERYELSLFLNKLPVTTQTFLGRVFAGATVETAQELAENVLQNLTALNLYDPAQQVLEGVDGETAGVSAVTGALVSAAIPGRQALQYRDVMAKAQKEIASAPLTERDPATAAKLAAEGLRANDVTIHMPAAKINELVGDDPAALAALGVSADELAAARERGGDVTIPQENFAREFILAPERFEAVADFVRYGDAAMNADEAKKLTEEAPAEKPTEPAAPGQGQPVAAKPAPGPVEIAEEEIGLQGLFQTASEAGMTQPEYEAYLTQRARAADAARKKAEDRVLKRQQQELSAEWQMEESNVRREMAEQIGQEPLYAALNATENERIDREALIGIIGKEGLEKLPKVKGRAIYAPKREQGAHPDKLAEDHGFNSAEEMLELMATAKPFDERVEETVKAEMARRHGSLADQRAAVDRAIEDLHNEDAAEALAYELHWLRVAKGEGRLKAGVFRDAARAGMETMAVGDINPRRFLDAERKFAKEAGQQLRGKAEGKKGAKKKQQPNRTAAARAKYQQLLNFQYAREAYDVARQTAKDLRLLKRFSNPRKKHPEMDARFVDEITALVSQYDFSERRASNPGQPRAYRSLTLAEFRELASRVRKLRQQGVNERLIFRKNQRVTFANAKVEMLEATDKLPDLGRVERSAIQGTPGGSTFEVLRLAAKGELTKAGLELRSIPDPAKSVAAGLRAAVSKMELVLQKLDGALVGPWKMNLWQPVADAESAELDDNRRVVEPLMKGMKKLSKPAKRWMERRVFYPDLGMHLRGAEVFMVLLNSGNPSNFAKQIEGSDKRGQKWTPDGVNNALSGVPTEVADLAQQVWDQYEKFRPKVEEVYRREFGSTPLRIESRQLVIGGKTYRGGYFPLMYDPAFTSVGQTKVVDLLKNEHFVGSVFSGMTKERTSFAAPILLDVAALPGALREHLHFIHFYQPIKNLRKVLSDRELGGAIKKKLGPEFHEEFERWMEAVATENASTGGSPSFHAAVSFIRNSFTIGVLGLSYLTMVKQSLGLGTSIAVLGRNDDGSSSHTKAVGWMAATLADYLVHPVATVREAFTLSGALRHRLENWDRDARDTLISVSGKTGFTPKTLAAAQKHSMRLIGGMQLLTVDVPTWVAAYRKRIAEGYSEVNAVIYADGVLRTSQGSGQTKDQTALLREKGGTRFLTMFSTYTSALFALQMQAAGDARKIKNVPGVVSRMAWMVALVAVVEGFIEAELPDEDDDENAAAWAALRSARLALSSIPIVGNFASALEGFDPSFSKPDALGRKWVSAYESAMKALDEDDEAEWSDVRKMFEALGLTIGIPGTAQIGRVMKAMEEDDPSLQDFLLGPKDD